MFEDDYYAQSNASIIAALGKKVRSYRMMEQLTQEELAAKAGISALTLKKFENAKTANINMQTFIALLRALHQMECIGNILPDLPVPPSVLRKYQDKTPKRIRHGK